MNALIKKEHIQQRIDAAKENLQEAWKDVSKIKILQIFSALELMEDYIHQTQN